MLSAGDGANYQKGFRAIRDGVRQWIIRRLEGKIFRTGKKPDEWPALQRHVVAHRPTQHRITGLQRVQHGPLQ